MQEAEFEQAVDRYGDMVFRLALSYLKNRADAEDIMQETLLKLYTQSRKVPFASLEHERFWVVRVAVNECKSCCAHPGAGGPALWKNWNSGRSLTPRPRASCSAR